MYKFRENFDDAWNSFLCLRMGCRFVTDINCTDFWTECMNGTHDRCIPGLRGQKQEGQKTSVSGPTNTRVVGIQSISITHGWEVEVGKWLENGPLPAFLSWEIFSGPRTSLFWKWGHVCWQHASWSSLALLTDPFLFAIISRPESGVCLFNDFTF